MSSIALPRPAARPARSFTRGRPGDPRWVRPALLAVIGLAAVLCLWNLTITKHLAWCGVIVGLAFMTKT